MLIRSCTEEIKEDLLDAFSTSDPSIHVREIEGDLYDVRLSDAIDYKFTYFSATSSCVISYDDRSILFSKEEVFNVEIM